MAEVAFLPLAARKRSLIGHASSLVFRVKEWEKVRVDSSIIATQDLSILKIAFGQDMLFSQNTVSTFPI